MLLDSTNIALKQITEILKILLALPKEKQALLFLEQRIGAHVRHVHDHFRSLFNGMDSGLVDYNQRNRESLEEIDLLTCLLENKKIFTQLNALDTNYNQIEIISEINCNETENLKMKSSVERELLYLINHTIHHAAIINHIMTTCSVHCPDEIGLAPGTATYNRHLSRQATVCAL